MARSSPELVASYTALHETTGLGLQYQPGPSVEVEKDDGVRSHVGACCCQAVRTRPMSG